jgi:2-oxoglutarate ferredoxin oxidoreductase subunit gamma
MRYEIRFAGFGGQGIISAGRITGRAAVLHDGKHAVLFQSYGPEARGGSCSTELVIADSPVTYPRVSTPDAVVIMSQEAYERYGHEVKPGGVLLIDSDLVEHEPRDDVRVVEVPATKLAETLGRRIVANVVMLGALVASWPAISKQAMLSAILESVPPKTRDLNERAFETGYRYVAEGAEAVKTS